MGDGPMDRIQVHYHVVVTLACGLNELIDMKIFEDRCPKEMAYEFVRAILKVEIREILSVERVGTAQAHL